jgi:hypothetical protein
MGWSDEPQSTVVVLVDVSFLQAPGPGRARTFFVGLDAGRVEDGTVVAAHVKVPARQHKCAGQAGI